MTLSLPWGIPPFSIVVDLERGRDSIRAVVHNWSGGRIGGYLASAPVIVPRPRTAARGDRGAPHVTASAAASLAPPYSAPYDTLPQPMHRFGTGE